MNFVENTVEQYSNGNKIEYADLKLMIEKNVLCLYNILIWTRW